MGGPLFSVTSSEDRKALDHGLSNAGPRTLSQALSAVCAELLLVSGNVVRG